MTAGGRHRHPQGGRSRGTLRYVVAMAAAVACLLVPTAFAGEAEDFAARSAQRDAALFFSLDLNGDGRLTREEVGSNIEMRARFDEFDVDRDGVITTAELERYLRLRYGVDPAAAMAAARPAPAKSADAGSGR